MQKLRDPDTIAGAVAKIVLAVGREWAAAATERSERQVYNWSDPDSGQCPTVAQAFELDRIYEEMTGEPGPIAQVFVSKRRLDLPHDPMCHNKRMGETVSELGEVAALESTLPQTGNISANDYARLCKECDDVISRMEKKKLDWRARLRSAPSVQAVS